MAALRNLRHEVDKLDGDDLVRVVRGMGAVDRAVAKRETPSLFAGPQPFPPTPVALELGWTICARCGRPLKPSWRISRGADHFHPVCIVFTLGERASVVLGRGGGRGLSALSEVPLPGQGAAGSRSAASGTSDIPLVP